MTARTVPTLEDLANLYLLESIKGFGPQKFKELHEDGISPQSILAEPREMQRFGKRGIDFKAQIERIKAEDREHAMLRARKQIDAAEASEGAILTYRDSRYPKLLYRSNLPVPVLYARGDLSVLKTDRAVACVGSRNIRSPYSESHAEFSRSAVKAKFAITSGFATGADIVGHLTAEGAGGDTICVMPSGLDRPFPPEHKEIWRRFIANPGAVFVSEFGFGVGANALNLRKRNKMIVGMALGVLVSQSAEDGGAMNAYRFAMEQKKPIATFKPDGTRDTSGNDLITGSAEHVSATVLPLSAGPEWTAWLRKLSS